MDGPRIERGSPPCEGEILAIKLSAQIKNGPAEI